MSSSKKALVIRPGHAIGDAVFITPVPRLLAKQGYQVDVACQKHNFEVFANNPFINQMIEIPMQATEEGWLEKFMERCKDYEKTFQMSGHLEVGLMHRTDVDWGTIPNGQDRRASAMKINYQDHIFKQAGVADTACKPEFYFSDDEKAQVAETLRIKREKQEVLVLWQWEGSSRSKELVFAPDYLREILKRVPNSNHYVFAQSQNMQGRIPDDHRVHNAWGVSGIRNTILLTSVADMVIGPESFMVNAAGAFDTPKMIFFSHSTPYNLAKYYDNCYAAVPLPDTNCHPCYLIHVDFRMVFNPQRRAVSRIYEKNCQTFGEKFPYRMMGYKCCVNLPHKEIMDTMVKVLRTFPKKRMRNATQKIKAVQNQKAQGYAQTQEHAQIG